MSTLTAQEAADRLGVKLATIYAYVSRGTLERNIGPDGRTSHFDSRQVEALARRGRPRLSSSRSSINMLIETHLTELTNATLSYRGHDVADLIRAHTFEEVADLLWSGTLARRSHPWRSASPLSRPAGSVGQTIRLLAVRAIHPTTTWNAPTPAQVIEVGRQLIADSVESLPVLWNGRVPQLPLHERRVGSSIAARLLPRLSSAPPTTATVQAINTALILLADHDLAPSTLAVRIAASTHASPAATVSAGLGVLEGPLHGGASRLCRDLLSDAASVGPGASVNRRLANKERIAGFGHRVYSGLDPRAAVLFDLLERDFFRSPAVAMCAQLREIVRDRTGKEANIDLALASLERAAHLRDDASEALFSIARIAGWLAHAIEEYQEPALRFRPRARYVGKA